MACCCVNVTFSGVVLGRGLLTLLYVSEKDCYDSGGLGCLAAPMGQTLDGAYEGTTETSERSAAVFCI